MELNQSGLCEPSICPVNNSTIQTLKGAAVDSSKPRHVELVKKLTEKTHAKKVSWKASDTRLSATVSGKLEIGFVRSNYPAIARLLWKSEWALFTIRDTKGNQILRIDNTAFPPPMEPLTSPVQFSVRDAVNDLYTAIEQSLSEEIDKAIEVIDRI